jgi:hypothetical protein
MLRTEQETLLSRVEDEDGWSVYTTTPHMVRRMCALADDRPGECVPLRVFRAGGKVVGMEWRVPTLWIKVKPPRKPTEKQLAHLARIRQEQCARACATGEEK